MQQNFPATVMYVGESDGTQSELLYMQELMIIWLIAALVIRLQKV